MRIARPAKAQKKSYAVRFSKTLGTSNGSDINNDNG